MKSHVLSLLLLSSAALGSPVSSQKDRKYAILDNDWGPVSFLPFLITAKSDIDILGLISDTGNTWQHQCALHALANLEVANLSCIPVYPGATWPLINTPHRFQAWEAIHGNLPFQGAFALENQTAEAEGNDPSSGDPNRVVRGAFVEGFPNITVNDSTTGANFLVEMVTGEYEQANINSDINLMIDPEAAKIALNADFPEIIIAGNVANQVQSTQEYLDEVYEVQNPLTELFHNHYGTRFPFWDETAAALMVNKSLAVNTTTAYIDVDISYGSPNYGNIHLYQEALAPKGLRTVTFVNEIDGEELKRMMKEAMQDPPTCH
ncbi:uncharacterized protein LDX57_002523 [Aspergillus melleus]|uniref:uncharacterized protein n=1 Tax=Aspergillus melleus TaxID=138277 RepID=UPI001E8E7695|nr:uncharacterized protein LDX57_002523 [Aspergillus melleus]KAH8424780.1 hypothetical protein LDX57_002523 [Aspergillus melleus]